MQLSLLLTVLAILICSSFLVQGSGKGRGKRLNRLTSSLNSSVKDTNDGLDTMSEPADASSNSTVEIQTKASAAMNDIQGDISAIESFSSPIPLEVRRIQIFHLLFSLYERVLGRYASSGLIEWFRVGVQNWPEQINKSDMQAWSEEDVDFLQILLDSNSIEFKPCFRGRKDLADPLILGSENGNRDDTHLVKSLMKLKEVKSDVNKNTSKNIAKTNVPACGNASNDSDSDYSESLKSSSDILDSSEESKDEIPQKIVSKSSFKKKNSAKLEFKSTVKIESKKPANAQKRRELLNKVLKVYRKQTGQTSANKIDWSLMRVSYLQYHTIPFSTDLKTEGDLLTLEKMMKASKFQFYDLKVNSCRRDRIYERLYRLYSDAVKSSASAFFVKWNQVDVIGWPSDISRSYSSWKLPEIQRMESLLDADEIKMISKNEKLHCDDSSSDDESDSSDISPALSPKKLATKRTLKETISAVSSANNPNEFKVNPSSKKKKKIESDEVISASTSSQNFGYEGESEEAIERIRNDLIAVISETQTTRQMFDSSPNHQGIFEEILKGLNLMLNHANGQKVQISLLDLIELLDSFHAALRSIEGNGNLSRDSFESFLIAKSKFHARLIEIAN